MLTSISFSLKVLSLRLGILIDDGILLRKVVSSIELGFSVVAAIIRTLAVLSEEVSPSLLNFCLSIYKKSISCPSGGSLWISSKNKTPPSASSINPFLSVSAPVYAPLTVPNN